ncbi:hypothetical protein BleG1_0234 [Shouchella lehensis G1]|uniref:Uncharacterized protein n=1 Tax=Shouchella lehensis G1 TaxID=1246626 RepID=A0A060LRQ1_9BACI|nr:hypothetical protein BleG1_0234 [Shouchella lehensis G1]
MDDYEELLQSLINEMELKLNRKLSQKEIIYLQTIIFQHLFSK